MKNALILGTSSLLQSMSLDEQETHVWLFPFKEIKNLAEHLPPLSMEEQALALQYKRKVDQEHFILRHQLLRELLRKYSSSFSLAFSRLHKPYLREGGLFFNASSSEEHMAFIFSRTSPVGIDIETIRPLPYLDEMVESYFSEEERTFLSHGNPLRRFFNIWTRKEAVLKALGVGMVDDLKKYNCYTKENPSHWVKVGLPCVKRPLWLCKPIEEPCFSCSIASIWEKSSPSTLLGVERENPT